jgi:hypothetical protein
VLLAVARFGQVLDPDWIANLELVTGALPAQYVVAGCENCRGRFVAKEASQDDNSGYLP